MISVEGGHFGNLDSSSPVAIAPLPPARLLGPPLALLEMTPFTFDVISDGTFFQFDTIYNQQEICLSDSTNSDLFYKGN